MLQRVSYSSMEAETLDILYKCEPRPQNQAYVSIFLNWDVYIIWKLNKSILNQS